MPSRRDNVAGAVSQVPTVIDRFDDAGSFDAVARDPLTGVLSRPLLLDRIALAIARRRQAGDLLGLLLVDIDRFSAVNTALGSSAGDELLREVGTRLVSLVRSGDSVGRMGDDEFGVLLDGIRSPEAMLTAARRVEGLFVDPITIMHHAQTVSVSIGASVAATERVHAAVVPRASAPVGMKTTADDLVRDAGLALTSAKQRGQAGGVLYQPQMHAAAVARLDLERELRDAIEGSQFVLEYQPEVALQGERPFEVGRVMHVEALIRWRHPVRGVVPPAEFIPAAEDTGLIVSIGRWVLREACRQLRSWQRTSANHRDLSISVNLSPRQLQHPALVADLAQALTDSGLAASSLTIEITEGAVIHDVDGAVETLTAIRALGVRIALDDFGTGYSSLHFLTMLPIDTVKIDREFVSGLGRQTRQSAVVAPLIQLAKVLGLQTVAEGIEHRAQADLLKSLGCDLGQGFYFSRPLGASGLTALLRSDARRQVHQRGAPATF